MTGDRITHMRRNTRGDRSRDERYEMEQRLRRRSYRAKQRRKRQIRRNVTLFAIAFILISAIGGTAISNHIKSEQKAAEAAARAETARIKAEKLEKEEKAALEKARVEAENTLTLVAVGDNIFHDHIIDTQENNTGTWNFDFLYQYVKPEIEQADIAIVNQETVLTTNHGEAKGYPCFDSPAETADALVNTGFDIVEQATNHAYDCGLEGVLRTLDYWTQKHPDIKVLGIHQNAEEAARIEVVEKKGIKIAFLNYTYGVNQEPIPDDQGYLIDLFTEQRVIQDIGNARNMADCVIVCLHAGEEGSGEISDYTRHMVQTISDAGADIILGSHPHVMQKYEVIAGSGGNQTLVYYSLGNFISTQQSPECLLGGMAEISIKRDPVSGQCQIESAAMKPHLMYYCYETKEYGAYWLEDFTADMYARHGIHLETDAEFTEASMRAMADAVLAQSSFTGPILLKK